MKSQLQQLLQEILKEIGVTDVIPDVSLSEDSKHGEYTTNVAMRLSNQLKKPPMDIALQVSETVNSLKFTAKSKRDDLNNSKIGQKISENLAVINLLQVIDRVEVAKPGFINIFLTEAALSTKLSEVLKDKEAYGTVHSVIASPDVHRDEAIPSGSKEHSVPNSKRITVEFTDPNPFKEFHIGHLYSNSVGESVCRLLESQGHSVRRVNYQGDVGMHVAKALYGLKKIENVKTKMEELGKASLADRAKFLGEAYAVGAKAFEEDKAAAEEMGRLNKLGFIAAQRMWMKEKGVPPVVDYAKGAQIDPAHDELSALYITGRNWSLEYFETIYKRLGTTFAGYYFESFVGERGAKMVRDHVSDGIFEESDGAIIYRGEKKGLHTRVFINKLGLPTYEAKELGLAPTKQDDWPYDLSIIVTGNEINEYFKVLLAALADVAPDLAQKTRHMGHGMVRKSDGSKMSSRSGMVLTGEGLLEEVKVSIHELLDKNESKYNKPDAPASQPAPLDSKKPAYTKEEKEDIAEKAAVAAVKYSLLRVSLPSDVAFDVKTSVSFDGDSGPYLLYSYARCRSVLRKASTSSALDLGSLRNLGTLGDLSDIKMNPEERAIARMITFFPDVVAAAAADYAPNVICTYLFDLAQSFNGFYQKYPILPAVPSSGLTRGSTSPLHTKTDSRLRENDIRLRLTAATAQVIKNGLYLLGIQTVERM